MAQFLARMVAGHSCQIALAIWIPELSRLLRQLHCNWLSIPFFKHMFPSFSTKWKENLGRGEGWGISTNRGDYCLFHLSRYPKTKEQQNKDLKKKGVRGEFPWFYLFIYWMSVLLLQVLRLISTQPARSGAHPVVTVFSLLKNGMSIEG